MDKDQTSEKSASRGRGRGRRPGQASPPGGLSEIHSETAASIPAVGLSPKIAESLANGVSKLQINPINIQPMARPGFGTAGKRIQLEANFFELRIANPDLIVYRYDVEIIIPPKYGRGRGKILTKFQNDQFDSEECRRMAYEALRLCIEENQSTFIDPDGVAYNRSRALFCVDRLNFGDKFTWTSTGKREPKYVVNITPARQGFEVKLSAVLDALRQPSGSVDSISMHLVDIVISQICYDKFYKAEDKMSVYAPNGNKFFKPMIKSNGLGSGRIPHDGFTKSIQTVMGAQQSGSVVCLNIDAKETPFFKAQSLLDTVKETLDLGGGQLPQALSQSQINVLAHHLKGIKVATSYGQDSKSMTYTISGFGCSAEDYKFKIKDRDSTNERELTVADYMKEKKLDVKYPKWPCVVSKMYQNDAALCIEFLTVLPGQKVDFTKTTPEQSKEMIKISAVLPFERHRDILDKAQYCGGGPDDPYCKAFGIERSLKMMTVAGRLLNPPAVEVGGANSRMLPVSRGQWNSTNRPLLAPTSINRWAAFACFDGARQIGDSLGTFIGELRKSGRQSGMELPETLSDTSFITPDGIADYFDNCVRANIACVMCFINNTDSDTYEKIKLHGDQRGLITQCIRKETVLKTVKRGDQAALANVILKMNLKNGGINNSVKDNDPALKDWIKEDGSVMFIGLSLVRPPSVTFHEVKQGVVIKVPSVIGAVANINGSMAKFTDQYYYQDARYEEISHHVLENCVTDFINAYQQHRPGAMPSRIVVFRNDVKESQYEAILNKELTMLKEVVSKLNLKEMPKLTMVAVQKHHCTRFFHANLTPVGKAPQQNIEPGIVVDVGPVNSSLFEFYLCSHTGLQGTSEPSKYVVLYDENCFTPDSIQRLVFVLCHIYQRCNKSVSLPAPVYFAQLASDRGKECYDAYTKENGEASRGVNNGTDPKAMINFDQIHGKIRNHAQFNGMSCA